MPSTFEYTPPGIIPKPGLIGRLVRFVMGIVSLAFALYVVKNTRVLILEEGLLFDGWWLAILLTAYAFPEVISLGFGLSWPKETIWKWLAITAAGMAVLGMGWQGSFFGIPLGGLVYLWLLYTHLHLGISFLLASLLAVPGCEMRSIPLAWNRLTGKGSDMEHVCPGFITPVDTWESRKAK